MERTPPPVFYKYSPVESWLPKLLSGESLKFSSRTTLNDPFECRPAFQISATTEAGKSYIQTNLKSAQLTPAQRVIAAARIRHQSKKVRSLRQEDIEQVLDDVGILCLSSTWDSPLLWSHYGHQHKGLCVGFKSDIDVFRMALPVKYQDELPILRRPEDSPHIMIDKTFLTKAKCWQYEDEWRVIKRIMTPQEKEAEALANGYLPMESVRLLTDQNGHGIYRFRPEAIESVTLGMHISKHDETTVISAVKDSGLRIPVYKVPPPHIEYRITRKRVR